MENFMNEQTNTTLEKRFSENLFSFIKEHTLQSDKFVLAISGGMDSMVLLDLFLALREQTEISFCVANVDHGIRAESVQEQQWLKSFCEKKDVLFFPATIDVKKIKQQAGAKQSLEQVAREERLRVLQIIKNKYQGNWVVTAHHRDDLLETFLLRLLRGTGLNGINTLNDCQGDYLRPLLKYYKEQLRIYARNKNLFYFEDRTNHDTRFLRNKIRHQLIPMLAQEFDPSIKDVLVRDMENLKQADQIISTMMEKNMQQAFFSENSCRISNCHLLNQSQAYLHEFLLRLYQKWHQSPIGLTSDKLHQISNRLNEHGDFEITITKDIRFLRSNEMVGFDQQTKRPEEQQKIRVILNDHFKTNLEEKNVITVNLDGLCPGKFLIFNLSQRSFSEISEQSRGEKIAFVDYDRLSFPLTIRFWQASDRIKPLGMEENKRVSRLLTNAGIKKYQKRKQLILENGKHDIIWCMGMRLSNDYKITPLTKRYLRIDFQEVNEEDFEGRERCIPQSIAKDKAQ